MSNFKLCSKYNPVDEQKKAIIKLVSNFKQGIKNQVLLGVTGSGKTYTIANVIEKLQIPTLIISHNKTLAAQLYQEFSSFFPKNAVSYFVSYYDYYQPEAYIPSTDTYIEKDADINDLIDKLRLSTTSNLLTRKDCIVIASVSCIYNIGSPKVYGKFVLEISKGVNISRNQIIKRLIELQYERDEFGFHRGSFRVRGDKIDIYPSYQDNAIRLYLGAYDIFEIEVFNPLTGSVIKENNNKNIIIYPSKHYITDPEKNTEALRKIKIDLHEQIKYFNKNKKYLEAHRLKQKVNYDLEIIKEIGYVKGIENYSRYFDGRKSGDPPFTLLDYFYYSFKNKWLLVVDESHITFPQIGGMFNGDLSRKKTLIDYGFRLPSALDNRPLTFDEFQRRIPNFIATSATPSEWEINQSINKKGKNIIVQQLVRPTGIPDPKVYIRPVKNQVEDVIKNLKIVKKLKQRSLITTLTKKTAEDLTSYLMNKGIKVNYLHSDVKTLERTEILDSLRRGDYDCIVGVNLLREGLDLPEVSLVAILDADKEGFLRSEKSLIQIMGRAARHKDGTVILYANKITKSINKALLEIKRRRKYQLAYNKKYNIVPTSIKKPFRKNLVNENIIKTIDDVVDKKKLNLSVFEVDVNSLTPMEKKKLSKKLKIEMRQAADNLDFELAIKCREMIKKYTY